MSKQSIKQALYLAGSNNRYQHILILLISLCWVFLNFMFLGSTLIFIFPVFNCNGDFDRKVFQKQACPQINRCQLIEKFTLTSQLQLYCQNQWVRNMAQSLFGVGCIIGVCVMNLLSDTKSRKQVLLLCLQIVSVSILIIFYGGFYKSYTAIILAQLIQGFGISSIIPLSYAFLSDFCCDKLKPKAVIIVNTAWSLSTILLGVFYLISIKWYNFLFYLLFVPFVIIIILFKFFLLQSPYILMLRGKKQQALKVLQKVAKINGREEKIEQIQQIFMQQQIQTVKNQTSIKNVFNIMKKWQFLKPLVLLSIIRVVGLLNFWGTSYAFDVQGLGLGYNSLIAGFLEIISFFFLTVYVDRIPRRTGIAGFYFLTFLIGLLFLSPSVKQNLLFQTIFMGVSRIFATIAYTLIASVQTQSFTVEIQSTAVGITQAFGYIGTFCGPLTVNIDKIGVDPALLIAILLNFAIIPSYFLKETLKPCERNNIKVDEQKTSDTLQLKEIDSGLASEKGLVLNDKDSLFK